LIIVGEKSDGAMPFPINNAIRSELQG